MILWRMGEPLLDQTIPNWRLISIQNDNPQRKCLVGAVEQ
jgi:hypothetical protein